MKWDKKVTLYLSEKDQNLITEVADYLSKQEYFSNEKITKSRIFMILVSTFHELFIENNSRKSYPNRMNQLKEIKPKDNQRILQKLSELKILFEFATYVSMANYQNVKKPEYTPDDLYSFQFGNDPEINSLTRRIVELREQDVATYKQMRDSGQKGSKR